MPFSNRKKGQGRGDARGRRRKFMTVCFSDDEEARLQTEMVKRGFAQKSTFLKWAIFQFCRLADKQEI